MVDFLCSRVTYILNDVAVVADKEEGAAVVQVYLHADETVRVPGKMMQRDALTEIYRPLVKSLPISA